MTAPRDPDQSTRPPEKIEASAAAVESQFDRLVALADRFDVCTDDVSRWSVGQHALHLAVSGSSLAVSLLSGRRWDGVPSAPELKGQILATGRIPPGRTEAPEPVRPAPDPTQTDVLSALSKCRTRVGRIMSAPDDAFIIHPYLGRLSRDELLLFITIHNRHHLGIIDRILDAE